MPLLKDLKILYHLALKPVRGNTHAQRLENFYSGQAEAYDDFRKRLLQGREELFQSISFPENGLWIDMGGGTGANLEWISDKIPQLKKVYVVDLSSSLLQIAEQRIQAKGWNHVEVVEADVTRFEPEEKIADVITFSYSLTMIPDWFSAIEQAKKLLKPGGLIGVVDFYVSRKHPSSGLRRHGWLTRHFWPAWFASDNVFLSGEHVPFLLEHFETVNLVEARAKVPYMPGGRVPYYRFIGRKR